MNKIKKVAVLTNGGDAPGLNAVIRAIVKTAEYYDIKVYGYINGYQGLLENDYVFLDPDTNAAGLLGKGGTIIGAGNSTNIFRYPVKNENGEIEYKDLSDDVIAQVKEEGFDCIFALGGDGTQKSARDFSLKGLPFIGIPKTIDNDVARTEKTFGFETAVSIATDALDKLATTAESHQRIMVLEVMGRYAGWIALHSGIAGAADAILIPEIPFDLEKVAENILEKRKRGKKHALIVVSESARFKDGEIVGKIKENVSSGLDNLKLGGIGEQVAMKLEELTGMVARNTTLGYVQRGGSPISSDRILATAYGVKAMELALDGIFNVLVTSEKGDMTYVSLEDVVGNNKEIGAASSNTETSNIKTVPLDHHLIDVAMKMGASLGI